MSRLNEHPRSPNVRRPYRMRRRAELINETRRRIIEAAVRLHTTIGPAATSLTAVAEEAGVTRLTLYRHFPTQDELFRACRAHWIEENPPPDTREWTGVAPLEQRLAAAIDQLYGWFAAHGDELFPIYRDMASIPEAQHAMQADAAAIVDAMLAGTGLDGAPGRRLRAAAGHAVSFWTWRSLAVEQNLGHDEAVDLAAQFVRAALPPPRDATVPSNESSRGGSARRSLLRRSSRP